MVVVLFVIAVALHGRQVEWMTRLDFLWQLQAKDEKHDMEALQTSNKRILFNLLPAHVANHFLDAQFRSNLVSYETKLWADFSGFFHLKNFLVKIICGLFFMFFKGRFDTRFYFVTSNLTTDQISLAILSLAFL